ncbi:MAG: YqhV family protein [Firmicutes bacterium]|nr:YqhV family protein [Bacillota bacterium]
MLSELRIVISMALFRILAGTLEITAALLMLKYAKVDTAIKINAVLGLIGPTILILVNTLGLIGLANQIPLQKILIVAIGVALIFLGTR